VRLLERIVRRARLLAAIPFLVGVASDHVVVETELYAQRTGVRTVVAAVDKTRMKTVETDLKVAYPDWRHWRRGDGLVGAERVIALGDDLPDADFRIEGGLLSLSREYVFEEKITVSDALSTTRDQNIRKQAPIEYRVIMPARVTEAAGAQIEGNTATFQLTLADDGKIICVKAQGVPIGRLVGFLFVLFAALVGVLNLLIPSRERRAAKATAESAEASAAEPGPQA
jgi:hypothetical protein